MKSPFKFLDSYTKDDREIFFGRDREIEELYHRVFESNLMLVYGVSGTGKSSLIHCGLANKFQETDWLPLVIRRGGNMLNNLALAIKAASITPQIGEITTPLHFKKAVRSLYLDHYKPVFLIFDQFEELFIFGNKEEKKSFIQVIKALFESEAQCRFIFVMREEYMAGFTEFERFIPSIFQNRVRIEKMSHINALDAIKGPCRVAGISLEEGFAETLVEKLSPESGDVELTYLQVFLDRILRLADPEKPTFSISLLSKVGNISDLLGGFLDEQIALMDDPDLAMSVLKSFVSAKGTKRPASESETNDNVKSLGRDISPESVIKLIQSFVRLRVLRDKDDQERYELRHDALAEKVYEKFSTAEKELLEIRQYIENAYQSFLKRKILLSNDDLIYISDKDSRLNLNPDLQGFIDESRKYQKAQLRTVRRLTAISAVSFVILISIPTYYVLNSMKDSKADRLAIRSMSQVSDPIRKLRIAGQAWLKSPDALPKQALIQAFNGILKSREKDSLMTSLSDQFDIEFDPAPVNIQFAECSNDNKYIFGYGDSLIFIWTIKGKLEKVIRLKHYPLVDIKMSGDSRFIGAISSDSILTIWKTSGEVQSEFKIQYNELNTKQIFKFTNGNNIVALAGEHDAVVYDTDGKVIQTFDRHKGRVNALDISPDNNFIATASCDSTIIIWYLNSVRGSYNYYNTLTWHHDTVRSVSFAKNNIYIVSSSRDHYARIGNINNEVTYDTYEGRNLCYAEFTSSGDGIIYGYFNYKDKGLDKKYYATNYKNPAITIHSTESYFKGCAMLKFSEDENYYTYSENNKIYLADNRLALEKDRFSIVSTFTFMVFTGTYSFFTTDNNYLMYIDRNIIHTCYINIDKINDIAQKQGTE
jgi:WD40 repeat protein